jgi:hypothetical protein
MWDNNKKNGQKLRLVDYLFLHESSREAVLVEIKAPIAKLLGTKYRGIYRPSREIVGAVVQALDYRTTLVKNHGAITEGTGYNIATVSPKCVVIARNGSAELNTPEKRRSFEYLQVLLQGWRRKP